MSDAVGMIEREAGPSWARANWPLAELDELNLGLDPTQATIDKVKAAVAERAAQTTSDPQAIRKAAEDSIRAMMLIRTYRVRGHLAADLDPLRLTRREVPADLTAEYHGFSDDDLDRPVWLCGTLGFEQATVREIVSVLQRNYCGHVGLEYMHINEVEERRFLQERMEGKDAEIHFTPEGKQSILIKVIHAEQWEKFLARKYVGTKRFGLDGGEGAVPALEAVIKYGGQYGVIEIDLGMSHRGRLNVLANVMGKPAQAIFHEFAGGATNPADVGGSGDVKYHLGTSSDREFDGNKVHLSLLPNPSHLEAVDPVVLGKARASQTIRGDAQGKTVLPILLRGCRATAPAARSISSSTTRSASRPARSSAAHRLTRPTSRRASRRRSSTSTATTPKRSPSAASSRPNIARRSAATSSSTCGAIAASATTKGTSRASPSRKCTRRSGNTHRSARSTASG